MLLLGLVEIPAWVVLLVVITTLLYLIGTRNFDAFQGTGIPGPKPWPFLGTMPYFLYYGFYKHPKVWKKKYGDVIVSFMGNKPGLVIANQEMILQVAIKQFSNFINRNSFPTGNENIDSILTFLEDDRWKTVRTIMSPTFTSGRLKAMCPEIERCTRQFAAVLANKEGPFEARDAAGCFTMDVIASTSFGLRINSQEDGENPFITNGKKMANISVRNPMFIIALTMPKLLPYLSKLGFSLFDAAAVNFFANIVEQTISGRQEEAKSRNDFVQLMVNAKRGEKPSGEGKDENEDDPDETGHQATAADAKGTTHQDIISNAIGFFLAGFDTTSIGLTYALYCLATNPDCQDKVIEEIKTHVGEQSELDYHTVHKLQYLDQCIQESLRLYPSLPIVNRVAKVDTEICGIKIKKGMLMQIPIYGIHHDSAFWPEPEKFDPERFTPEAKAARSPTSWLPFGIGPRNCIGMRLALLEIKMALIQLLRTHKLVTCDKTEIPLQLAKSKYLKAINGVWLAVQKH